MSDNEAAASKQEIDWETINEKLPYERNRSQKKKRRELFKQFDPNGNGYVSLAEVSILHYLGHTFVGTYYIYSKLHE